MVTEEWEGIISDAESEDAQSGSPALESRARNPATPPPASHSDLLTPVTESRHIRFTDDGLDIAEQATLVRTLYPRNTRTRYGNQVDDE
ncbi:hypothetical protein PG984_002896 [Apiospora sp. TS-2023a]